MSLVWAFLSLDWNVAKRYKFRFAYDFLHIFSMLAIFYFLSKGLGKIELVNGEYFPYVLLGITFSKLYQTFSQAAVGKLVDLQYLKMLDAIFVSPQPLWKILISMGSTEIVRELLQFIFLLCACVYILGIPLSQTGVYLPHIFMLTLIFCFILGTAMALIACCSILLWKRVNLVNLASSLVIALLGGVYFPIKVLPVWLQSIAKIFPFTHAMSLMRYSMGAQVDAIQPLWSLIYLGGVALLFCFLAYVIYLRSQVILLSKGQLNTV